MHKAGETIMHGPLRGLGAGRSPWQSGLFFIEKSPKMLRGYAQKNDKVFGKIRSIMAKKLNKN
jgi:hypothetical protein